MPINSKYIGSYLQCPGGRLSDQYCSSVSSLAMAAALRVHGGELMMRCYVAKLELK